MRSRIGVVRMLGLVLGTLPAAVPAQQFYNPSHFQATRQALTNRAITARLGRKHGKRAAVKPAPKRETSAPKAKSAASKRS
jgi:hypothetical protein